MNDYLKKVQELMLVSLVFVIGSSQIIDLSLNNVFDIVWVSNQIFIVTIEHEVFVRISNRKCWSNCISRFSCRLRLFYFEKEKERDPLQLYNAKRRHVMWHIYLWLCSQTIEGSMNVFHDKDQCEYDDTAYEVEEIKV